MTHLSPKQKEILQVLSNEKYKGNLFVYMQNYRRQNLIILRDLDYITASKSPVDKIRYAITKRGENALLEADLPVFKYWFNGNGYETLREMAEGENMTIHQARWRHKHGYLSEADKAHGGAVIVAGKLYKDVKTAAEMLGYKPKSIRKIIAKGRQPKVWKSVSKTSQETKRYKLTKAFERLGIEAKKGDK